MYIVRICQPLSKVKGAMAATKMLGENYRLRCRSHSCRAGGVYNFTKYSEDTQELLHIHQGKSFSKTITDYSDAGILSVHT